MNRHEDTTMRLDEIGSRYPEYQPTFDFAAPYINPYHLFLSSRPRRKGIQMLLYQTQPFGKYLIDHVRDLLVYLRNLYRFGVAIPGWLRREEALKLYEMAYFVQGDVLELGSYHGLSTSILCRAANESPNPKTVFTVDLDPACIISTVHNLRKMEIARGVVTTVDDAASAVRRFAGMGKRFSFVFIDHSHTYQHCLDVCKELPGVVEPGAFCLFHDYNHPANKDPVDNRYGVYQAVGDGLDKDRFEFYGIYGSAGLFRAR